MFSCHFLYFGFVLAFPHYSYLAFLSVFITTSFSLPKCLELLSCMYILDIEYWIPKSALPRPSYEELRRVHSNFFWLVFKAFSPFYDESLIIQFHIRRYVGYLSYAYTSPRRQGAAEELRLLHSCWTFFRYSPAIASSSRPGHSRRSLVISMNPRDLTLRQREMVLTDIIES